MYQKKYTPEESIRKIKLMMGYDMSKTLNENRVIIEQIDLFTRDAEDLNSEFRAFNTDENKVKEIILGYKDKASFEKLLAAYQNKFQKSLGQDWNGIDKYNDKNEWNEITTHLNKLGYNLNVSSDDKGRSLYSFVPIVSKSASKPIPIPAELKDVNGVKAFQDWLDQNKAGWAQGYPEGKLNRAKGYGRFGPRTQKAWNQYKKEYFVKPSQSNTQMTA